MAKHGLTHVLHCLLNQGTTSPSGTAFFRSLKRDDLVNTLVAYLNAHRRFLSGCHIESTQALNDKGVDLILEANGVITKR